MNNMITELKITGFRGFKDFSLHDLGRINLLVGSNNGGKTSVLEPVEFFASRGDPMPLCEAMMRRGECKWSDSRPEIDIRHLFYGHETEPDIQFSISGKCITSADTVQAAIPESEFDSTSEEDDEFLSPHILKLTWNGVEVRKVPKWLELRLSHQGGISYDKLRKYSRSSSGQSEKSFFISTDFLSVIPIHN